MQSKKRISRSLFFVTFMSIATLFLFVSCNGRWNKDEQAPVQVNTESAKYWAAFPQIDDEWIKSTPQFKFDSKSVQEFLSQKKIKMITFLSEDGFAYNLKVNEFIATAIIPCADLDSLPGNCKSLNREHFVQGIDQVTLLRTRKNPPCIAITIGGYVIEIDLATGEVCQ